MNGNQSKPRQKMEPQFLHVGLGMEVITTYGCILEQWRGRNFIQMPGVKRAGATHTVTRNHI
jgi:hypothetical protein